MYFTGHDGYHFLKFFAQMLYSLSLYNNKKVIDWISTGVLPEKKPIWY